MKAARWNLKLFFHYLEQILCFYFCYSLLESLSISDRFWHRHGMVYVLSKQRWVCTATWRVCPEEKLAFCNCLGSSYMPPFNMESTNLLQNWEQTSAEWQHKLSLILSCNLGLFFNVAPDRAVQMFRLSNDYLAWLWVMNWRALFAM